MEFAPICLVAHRRPQHLRQCLYSLAQCAEARKSAIYIFVDGPRNDQERVQVEEVIDCATLAIEFGDLSVIASPVNLGMTKSVVGAVSRVIKERGRAIVVEDDLVVSPSFLAFMNDALNAYANIEQVFGISGYLFKDLRPVFRNAAFFSRRPSCWGWATWSRAWRHFDHSRESLLYRIKETGLEKFLDPVGALSISNKLRQGIDGIDHSWSPMWFSSVALADGFFLYPPASMTSNIGFDGSGEHQLITHAYKTDLVDFVAPVQLPNQINVTHEVDELFVAHYRESYSQR